MTYACRSNQDDETGCSTQGCEMEPRLTGLFQSRREYGLRLCMQKHALSNSSMNSGTGIAMTRTGVSPATKFK